MGLPPEKLRTEKVPSSGPCGAPVPSERGRLGRAARCAAPTDLIRLASLGTFP